MRALFVLEAFGSAGTENYVARACQESTRYIDDLAIVSLNQSNDDERSILLQSSAQKYRRHPASMSKAAFLRSVINDFQPDVVDLHLYTSLMQATTILHGLRQPCTATLHIPWRNWSWRYRLEWIFALRAVGSVIAVSEAIRQSFPNVARVPPASIVPTHLPKFCKIDTYNATLQSRDANSFRILGVGRLSTQKRWDLFLRTIATALPSIPHAECEILGDGPDRGKLEKLSENLGIQTNVHFCGFADPNVVNERMLNSHAFMMTSDFEGYPVAAVEAIMSGLPVILTDFGAAKEILPSREHGTVVPRGNVKRLADALILVAHEYDRARHHANIARENLRTALDAEKLEKLRMRAYECAIRAQLRSDCNAS